MLLGSASNASDETGASGGMGSPDSEVNEAADGANDADSSDAHRLTGRADGSIGRTGHALPPSDSGARYLDDEPNISASEMHFVHVYAAGGAVDTAGGGSGVVRDAGERGVDEYDE